VEIHARYTLIGAFVLATVAGVFSFIFWMHNGGGIGQRALYRVRYENSVAGLLKGSAVLFNGVRIGEVSSLQIEPKAPRQIIVTISVDPQTPVRSDTRVSIEFQGLSGAPAVALSGGSAEAAAPPHEAGQPPLLVADPDAGLGLTQAARQTLKKIDAVVAANSEPLRSAIANIDSFAGALARNSGRVDGIMAGVERLTGGAPKQPSKIISLASATTFAGLKKLPAGQLVVPDPTTLMSLDTAKLLIQGEPLPGSPDLQFPDTLTRTLQMRVVQSFENAGYLRILARSPDGVAADFQMLLDIRQFGLTSGEKGRTAQVEYGAKVLNRDGRMMAARILKAQAPVTGEDVFAVSAAIEAAFGNTLSELVVWACGAITAAEAEPKTKKSATSSPPKPGAL